MNHMQEPSPMVPKNRFLGALPTRQQAGGEIELPLRINGVALNELFTGVESGLVGRICEDDDPGETV